MDSGKLCDRHAWRIFRVVYLIFAVFWVLWGLNQGYGGGLNSDLTAFFIALTISIIPAVLLYFVIRGFALYVLRHPNENI